MSSHDQAVHPEHIGPYRIVRVIGEGGMGVVYEAEQHDGIRRRVALKMMKVGLDTKEVVRRFESERTVLASMDHPSIAAVLDAGANEVGRPYFVMELVRGIPLDVHCDLERLTNPERIALMVQVCDAVQHAHQKGVIHRDLKPSNVLVTQGEKAPIPKIIDFGIAKAIEQTLGERTAVTTYGQTLGTLAYMSPEQADMSGAADTRTDVFSLGVILFRLLTGRLPVDPTEMSPTAFLAELLREDRSLPSVSQALAKLSEEELKHVLRARRTTVRHLSRELGGDLKWVVQKSIEKDPERRYETASGFATDLRRYLANEPIVARPPTTAYRVGKFVRRNKALSFGTATVAVTLLAGSAGATVGMVRAQAAETEAQREAETAAQIAAFLTGMFEVNDPSEALGNVITAREILDASVDRVSEELADQPLVQARLMMTMGQVYEGLRLTDEAEALFMGALAIYDRELGPEDPRTVRARAAITER